MEEEKYTAYDLEAQTAPAVLEPTADTGLTDNPEITESKEMTEDSANVDAAGCHDGLENPVNSETKGLPKTEKSPAEEEIDRMMEKVGAEKMLEIIKGNRNAAIKQIISEITSSTERRLPSGDSAYRKCNSIFDLAELAKLNL